MKTVIASFSTDEPLLCPDGEIHAAVMHAPVHCGALLTRVEYLVELVQACDGRPIHLIA
jgi:hypothetical protein